MASNSYQVAVLLIRPGPAVVPAVGAVVEAIDSATITAGDRLSGEDIVATATTNEAGVASLLAVPGDGPHVFRARISEPHFIEVLESSATGAGGCWDAIIKSDGSGTDATLAAAITRLNPGGGGSILICDILDEEVTFPGLAGTTSWQIQGIERDRSGIITSAGGGVAVLIENAGVTPAAVRFADMRIGASSGTGTTTAIQLGSVISPAISDLRLVNVLIDSGGTGTQPTHAIWVASIATGIVDSLIDQCEIHTSGDAIRMGAVDVIISKTWLDSAGIGYTGQSGQLGLHIVDCYFTCGDRCLNLGTLQGFVIANNEFNSTVNDEPVIKASSLLDGQIIGNTIQRTVNATTGDGIQLVLFIKQVAIANNFFGRVSSHRHGIHLDTATTEEGFVIQGNTIRDCVADGIHISQLLNNPCNHIVIVGNAVDGCGGNGITFNQASTPETNNQMKENVVSGNSLTNNGSDGIEFLGVGEWYDSFAITGNVICTNGAWGITAPNDADVRNSTICVNVLQNNVSGTIQNLTHANNGKIIQDNA